jgi:hypothetical protein
LSFPQRGTNGDLKGFWIGYPQAGADTVIRHSCRFYPIHSQANVRRENRRETNEQAT